MVNVLTNKEGRKLRKDIRELKKIVKVLDKEVQKFKNPECVSCGSREITKRGTRGTIERGVIQKYSCGICGYKFSTYDLYHRMRHSKEKIEEAIKLRKQGLSYSQIADRIEGISRQTIMRWLKKYSPPSKKVKMKRKMKDRYGGEYEREFEIKI